jgi:hypothetical protein
VKKKKVDKFEVNEGAGVGLHDCSHHAMQECERLKHMPYSVTRPAQSSGETASNLLEMKT